MIMKPKEKENRLFMLAVCFENEEGLVYHAWPIVEAKSAQEAFEFYKKQNPGHIINNCTDTALLYG